MNTNIVIPDKIKVGYQNRQDTYSKKLAYVIYYDNKNELRKEKSWAGWRDETIEPNDFANEPTEGFVLNKKVGGDRYGWNPRQTYCRIFDPRGFEFEITIPNLLYILENTNSIKGKGLEGSFVYGWHGTELVLIPINSVEFEEIKNYNSNLGKKVSKKNLVEGKIYLNKQNERLIYLGYFDEYERYGNYKNLGKKFWFKYEKKQYYLTYSSLNPIMTEVDDVVNNYVELIDELEHCDRYSPHDETQYKYEMVNNDSENFTYFNNEFISVRISNRYNRITGDYNNFYLETYYNSNHYYPLDNNTFKTKEELINNYQFYKQIKVLKNGKIAK